MEKSSFNNSLPITKEKKELHIAKTKKKKEKKKLAIVSKRKVESLTAKTEANKEETSPLPENTTMINNLAKNSIVYSGLVAHGSCNQTFLSRPRFSNTLSCGCSSLGKYKVGEFYR